MHNAAALILRTARAVAGVSQQDLARRAGIGQNRLSELEHGRRRLRPDVAARLWQALILPEGAVADEEVQCGR